jgi:hypothetical protein
MDKNSYGFKRNVSEPSDKVGERVLLENYNSVAMGLKTAMN